MDMSILGSTKKILGIAPSDTAFDQDILTFINSSFSKLTQIGVGPTEGYSIEDDSTEWDEFIGDDPVLNMVQTYIYLSTRLLFDPPATSFAINAIQEELREMEQRISYHREWMLDPTDPRTVSQDVVFDPIEIGYLFGGES